MEIWVQGTLFPTSTERATRPNGLPLARRASPRRLHVGWAPVTRDPAVAASSAEGTRIAGDVRAGLARSLDRLSPELRQSIRAAVSRPRTSAAAA